MAEANSSEQLFWGATEITKRCTKCGKVKPLNEFQWHKSKGRKPRRESWCRSCKEKWVRAYWKKHPEKYLRSLRKTKLRKRFGLTENAYREMQESQQGLCAICGKAEKRISGKRGMQDFLSVDHDHATGKVRGLLCHKCNVALGLFCENVEILRKAIFYLQTHKQPIVGNQVGVSPMALLPKPAGQA